MKKIIFISGIVNISTILIICMLGLFNQNNLNLYQVAWFDGFDITLLFPSSLGGNLLIIGSLLGVIFIFSICLKVVKNKTLF
jgi:hypothetical protein